MNELDLLTIGDVTSDAFIKIKDATVNCDIDNINCQICLRFGDKVPFESATVIHGVGNSANAAVSAARLNLKVAFYGVVGDDENGRQTVVSLKKEGVDPTYLAIDPTEPTNYHYVLWYGNERTILVNHHHYNYHLPALPKAKGIYLSSLGESSKNLYSEISAYLKQYPDTFLTFQPGTFQMKLGTAFLKEIYQRTNLLVVNVDEAKRILNTPISQPTVLMTNLHKLGPNFVVVTDGPKGAYASDGSKMWFMPPYPDPKEPVERTGAGDAFASTLTAALLKNKPFEKALSWAPINSMNVVQYVGAQEGLLTEPQLLELLSEAPDDYHPRPL
jgi:ribokinase